MTLLTAFINTGRFFKNVEFAPMDSVYPANIHLFTITMRFENLELLMAYVLQSWSQSTSRPSKSCGDAQISMKPSARCYSPTSDLANLLHPMPTSKHEASWGVMFYR